MVGEPPPTISDILAATDRIAPFVLGTPVVRSDLLDERFDARVLFKCEHLQHTGRSVPRRPESRSAIGSPDDRSLLK